MVLLSMRRDKGFTLLEMMTVIAITAILSAIAIPNFISYAAGMKLRSAGSGLYSNMQKARMYAIRQNTTWTIQFTPSGSGFSDYKVLNSGTVVNITNGYPGIVGSAQTFPGNQALFYSDGTSNGGTVTFLLPNSAEPHSTVTVLPSGGIKSS